MRCFFQPFLDCPDAMPEAILIGTTDWKENSNLPPNMPHCGFRGELDICKVNGQRALFMTNLVSIWQKLLNFLNRLNKSTTRVFDQTQRNNAYKVNYAIWATVFSRKQKIFIIANQICTWWLSTFQPKNWKENLVKNIPILEKNDWLE